MRATDPHRSEALHIYTEALFAREDALLRDLREEIGRRGFPRVQVSAVQGKLLQVLLRAVQACRVLEIGTLGGYSAIWMARALPADGRVVTLELEEEHASLARQYLARARLTKRVEVCVGPAADTLRRLVAQGEEGSFDACFIDADKESYPAYLRWARRLVRVGGLILADNAFWGGSVLRSPAPNDGAAAMQQFNRMLARDPGLAATLVPIGDGLACAVVTDDVGRRAAGHA